MDQAERTLRNKIASCCQTMTTITPYDTAAHAYTLIYLFLYHFDLIREKKENPRKKAERASFFPLSNARNFFVLRQPVSRHCSTTTPRHITTFITTTLQSETDDIIRNAKAKERARGRGQTLKEESPRDSTSRGGRLERRPNRRSRRRAWGIWR